MIAIFGGTFDPFHRGHEHLATLALEAKNFEKLLLVPARKNPLKSEATLAGGEHRLAMIRAALDERADPRLSAIDWELKRSTPSYAITTVEQVLAEFKRPVCFLLGEEVYRHLARWHRAAELFELCSFLVVNRAGEPTTDLRAPWKELNLTGWEGDPDTVSYAGHWASRLTLPPVPTSASELREVLQHVDRKGPCPDGLHQQVWEYIKENALYLR